MRLLLIFLLLLNISFASSDVVFGELLKKVKQGYSTQTQEDKNREQRFLQEKNRQEALVSKLKKEIQKLKKQGNTFKKEIQNNEIALQKLTKELTLASGDLGELFGTVKQISSDLKVHIKASLISSTLKERNDFLKVLTSTTKLPDSETLQKLWYIMLEEIVEAGKIVKYKTSIITKEGNQQEQEVIRFGNFNAITQESFLHYNSANAFFIEPNFQPSSSYLNTVSNYFTTEEPLYETVIDPTRGTLLDLISQKPTLEERISQGGIIGYIIISLGLLGLSYALIKYLWLEFTSFKIRTQSKNIQNVKYNNPLGRILHIYSENKTLESEELEHKIDEALYKEIPPIQSGFSMLKLFAATSPLLGLLGTVTGMILTFQSITLFGTSDPKLMADGISQALITTMLGLSVAIPLLFAHTFLLTRSKKIITFLEQESIALITK